MINPKPKGSIIYESTTTCLATISRHAVMADKVENFSLINPQTDPYGYLNFVKNSDGSITRKHGILPDTAISSYGANPNLLVKDIVINQSKNTWARIFLPKKAIQSCPNSKLPLLIFFHGGGFVVCSAATSFFDDFYSTFTTDVKAVIVSIDYRLAPEYRLPVAYDDCKEALEWIKTSQDEWLTNYVDLPNSYVMGSSAGANIAYHVGLSASLHADDLKPLIIKGLILHQPFFGGKERTESELRGVDDKILPPCLADVLWELALPEGADRDHEFCYPMRSVKSGQFDKIRSLGWKILVTGYEGDTLFDRQVQLVKMLEEKDVTVVANFQEGGYHGVDTFDQDKLKALCGVVKEFMKSIVAN